MGQLNASKDFACPLLSDALTGPLGPRPRGPGTAICDPFARSLIERWAITVDGGLLCEVNLTGVPPLG